MRQWARHLVCKTQGNIMNKKHIFCLILATSMAFISAKDINAEGVKHKFIFLDGDTMMDSSSGKITREAFIDAEEVEYKYIPSWRSKLLIAFSKLPLIGKDKLSTPKKTTSLTYEEQKLVTETGYHRPAFANRLKVFDATIAKGTAFGIVIARGEIGEIKNENMGNPSIITVYVLKGNAGGINHYTAHGKYTKPMEEQNFYSYGGDNMITGNPQVGDMVSWRGKNYTGGEYGSYGWTLYLEATDRKKSYDFISNIVSREEYDKATDELKDIADWMRKQWSFKEESKYSFIESDFPVNTRLLTENQINNLIKEGKVLQ
jgi:hypothetical protein